MKTISCSKSFRKKKKFTNRGMKKLEKDFDLLNIIKKLESIAILSLISITYPQK